MVFIIVGAVIVTLFTGLAGLQKLDQSVGVNADLDDVPAEEGEGEGHRVFHVIIVIGIDALIHGIPGEGRDRQNLLVSRPVAVVVDSVALYLIVTWIHFGIGVVTVVAAAGVIPVAVAVGVGANAFKVGIGLAVAVVVDAIAAVACGSALFSTRVDVGIRVVAIVTAAGRVLIPVFVVIPAFDARRDIAYVEFVNNVRDHVDGIQEPGVVNGHPADTRPCEARPFTADGSIRC